MDHSYDGLNIFSFLYNGRTFEATYCQDGRNPGAGFHVGNNLDCFSYNQCYFHCSISHHWVLYVAPGRARRVSDTASDGRRIHYYSLGYIFEVAIWDESVRNNPLAGTWMRRSL